MGASCSSQNDASSMPSSGSLAPIYAFDGPKDAAVGGYDHEWKNHFEDIMIAQLGEAEYQHRRKKQDELFMDAAKKGGALDYIELKVDIAKFSGMFALASMKLGKRGTHPNGIGMSGYARVDPDPSIPKSDFFKGGKLFEIRARHSNFPFSQDQTMMGVRSLSVKFADMEEGGPLDLICHSGRCSNFFNSESIYDQVTALANGPIGMKDYLLKLPVYLAAFIEDGRILPDSFYHNYYHAHTVFHFTPNDGYLRLARFRIVPADGSRESGRLTKEEQMNGEAWNFASRVDDKHSETYLNEELKNRLENETIIYQVQIQLYEPPKGKKVNHHMYNASIPWKESKVPWKNLMTLHFLSILPDHVIEVTKFTIGNTSDPISIPKSCSDDDFNSIPNIRKSVYKKASSQRPKELKDFGKNAVKFQVTVSTGDKKGSGTDADIYISLVGTAGRSSYRQLNKKGVNDFEKSNTCSYNVSDMDIGELLCAKIHTEPEGVMADWFVHHISIKFKSGGKDHSYTLPCYRWFTEKVLTMTLIDGTAKLPQHEKHPYMILQRSLMIQNQELMYAWKEGGLERFPGYSAAGSESAALPRDARFDDEKEQDVVWNFIIGQVNLVSGKQRDAILDAFKKDRDPFKAKGVLLTEIIDRSETMKHIIEHWNKDEEFARQFLQGMNPYKIRRVVKIPDNFPVTNDMVKDELDEGKTLQDEIMAKKVYMASYPELDADSLYQSGQKRYICAPMCLFYVKNKILIPIAIQLSQTPGKKAPIFTKKDDKADQGNTSDWLLAKMWVKSADFNFHQLSVHLMGTHLVMEPFGIAAMRNLPSMHPMYKLLLPHVHFTLAINTLGRKVLIPDGTSITQVLALGGKPGQHIKYMAEYYQNHLRLDTMDIPKDLEERGVKDADNPPGYHFRDDALKLWEAIKVFVQSVLDLYYKEDDDVLNDTEIQSFMTDLKNNGCHARFGLPEPLDTKEKLLYLMNIVIYRASCGHASVNFGQLDAYAFTPNAPGYMMAPPPTSKNPQGVGPDDMQKILPTDDDTSRTIAIAQVLSTFSDRERFLGDYPDQHFTEKETQAAIKQFQGKLKEIAKSINQRNKSLPIPYNYLNPEEIPNSIAV